MFKILFYLIIYFSGNGKSKEMFTKEIQRKFYYVTLLLNITLGEMNATSIIIYRIDGL